MTKRAMLAALRGLAHKTSPFPLPRNMSVWAIAWAMGDFDSTLDKTRAADDPERGVQVSDDFDVTGVDPSRYPTDGAVDFYVRTADAEELLGNLIVTFTDGAPASALFQG